MRLFGSERVEGLMDRMGLDDDVPIELGFLSSQIESAQKKVEARNFDIRKHVLQYDDVMNQQRTIIYQQRRQVLEGKDLSEVIAQMRASCWIAPWIPLPPRSWSRRIGISRG